MKCPKCPHDQRRGQQGMTCNRCGYQFIFDPRSHRLGSKAITDHFFQKLLDKTSRRGTYHFTQEEFHFVTARTVGISFAGCLFLSIFLIAISSIVLFALEAPAIAAILIPLIGTTLLFLKFGRKTPSRKRCSKFIRRWEDRNGPIPLLLREPTLDTPKKTTEPDTFHYGAANILITQDDIQVDWLVRNGFHTQNATIVISQNGYPTHLKPHIDKLLTSPEPITVHLLHNTNTTPEDFLQSLKQNPAWNISNHKTNPIGITTEMLDKLPIRKAITKQYKNSFPAHALPYHTFAPVAALAITETQTFLDAWNHLHASASSFAFTSEDDGDFG